MTILTLFREGVDMKIALTMEKSQADKNNIVFETLKKVADKYGHTVFNYGQYSADDSYQISYNQQALLNAILLNGQAVDFIVTGCGTGMGVMIASNAFPGVQCGFIADPVDAKLISEINYVNVVSTPFAKGFGWGGDLNLEMMLEQLLIPKPECRYLDPETDGLCIGYKNELDYLKSVTHKPIIEILENYDRDSLKNTVSNEKFKDYFFPNCRDKELFDYIERLL